MFNCKRVLFLYDNAMWRRWPAIPYGDAVPSTLPRSLYQQITTSSILWATTFVGNTSQMRLAYDRHFFASKTVDFYRQCFAELEERWQNVMDAGGDYFEDEKNVKFAVHRFVLINQK